MSYLEQYDSIPMERAAEKVQLASRWIRTDWRPFFKELREKRPIFKTPAFIFVTRFDDVQEVLSREDIFSVRLYAPKMDPVVGGPFMLARDNTEVNWREKGIMQAMLQREDLPRVRKMSGDIAKESLDNAAPTGKIEVVNQLGRYVPIRVCGDYFGFPGPNLEAMYRWSKATQSDMFKNLTNDSKVHETSVQAGQEMTAYLSQLLQEKRSKIAQETNQKPTPGSHHRDEISVGQLIKVWLNKLVGGENKTQTATIAPPAITLEPNGKQATQPESVFTRLVRTHFAEDLLFDDKRLVANMAGLLIGAGETTSQAIVQALEQILHNPDVFQGALKAAQANDDKTFDKYVWEALRFNPINPLLFRFCEADYTIASGTSREAIIPAKSIVFACTASALFDETELKDAETFSIDRPDYHYMHFGYGHHTCLGKYIGLMQIPEVIKQVILRPGVRLIEGDEGKIDFQGGPFPEKFVIAFDG